MPLLVPATYDCVCAVSADLVVGIMDGVHGTTALWVECSDLAIIPSCHTGRENHTRLQTTSKYACQYTASTARLKATQSVPLLVAAFAALGAEFHSDTPPSPNC